MSSYEQIEVETADGVARLTLNRPEALNPLSLKAAAEMGEALASAAADDEVRAVLISGAGRGFSSGADLGGSDAAMTDSGKPDVLTGLREVYNPLILAVREIPIPVVAAVNGPAAGIGASLALACDLVIAAESSYLLMAFARIGLTVDGGASAFLAARMGFGRAAEMALLAEKVPAPQALDWGLINRVVPDDELAAAGTELAQQLAEGPTRSYAASKALLNSACFSGLAEQLDLEAVRQQELAESEDFGIGVMGFLSKQKPEFKGR